MENQATTNVPSTSYKEVRIGKTIYCVTSVFTGEKDLGEILEQLAVRRVMAEAGYLMPPDEETVIHVAIVTSNFHVFRSKGIARKIGLTDNSGIAARSDPVLFLHFCVRECFAILKDKFMGNM